ncbi:HXBDA protein, partial [Certhia brachydactyla]|nr:HXBDA protein [Certhia brachydactyla]
PKAPPGSAAPLPYGYFGSGYYSCRVARGTLKAAPGSQGPFPAEKFLEPPGTGEDFQSRPPEFAFYPGYGAPYQPVAGYLDVSVVPALGEPRHEALLPGDGGFPQPWAIGAGWSGQVCCPKEQGQAGFLLKSAFADGNKCLLTPALPAGSGRGVPGDGLGYRERVWGYRGSRFISRDKRRRISAATNLSERQVTIWFQNRRVKDKRGAAKGKGSA